MQSHSYAAQHGDKSFATVQAKAAMAGFALHRVHDPAGEFFFACRWNCSRSFSDLAEVETWLNTGTGSRKVA